MAEEVYTWSSIKKMLDTLEISRVEKVVKRIEGYIESRKEREVAREEEIKLKKEKIEEKIQQMEAEGISRSEFLAACGISTGKTRKPSKKRYRYVDVDGNEQFWSGQGRIPKKMVEVMQRDGKQRDDYRLPESEW